MTRLLGRPLPGCLPILLVALLLAVSIAATAAQEIPGAEPVIVEWEGNQIEVEVEKGPV